MRRSVDPPSRDANRHGDAGQGAADHRFVVEDADANSRLDAFVARRRGTTVREAARLCGHGQVFVDGRPGEKGRTLKAGAVVEVHAREVPWLSPTEPSWWNVVYEDHDLVVIDKPAGVPSHPLQRGEGGTAADAVAARYPEVANASPDPREGGAVHRLDTGTSGLLAFARSRQAYGALRRAFVEDEVERAYIALVEGRLDGDVLLTGPIAHHASDKKRMVVVEEPETRARGTPRPARSAVRVTAAAEGASLVVVETRGGRRHQVRVHLASTGHPLVGDALYGSIPEEGRQGHMLHAAVLGLPGRPRLLVGPGPDFGEVTRRRGIGEDAIDAAIEELARADGRPADV